MITPGQIRTKAENFYPTFVKNWLEGKEVFPKRLRVNLKPPSDHVEAKRAVEALRAASKAQRGFGFEITWQAKRSRTHGQNDFPVQINFDTQLDFLKYAGKQIEFETLGVAVKKLREAEPALASWLLQSTNWKQLVEVADELDDLLLMTRYLVDNPRPDMFAREIPLPVSTKLIEVNKKLLAQWLEILLPSDQIDFRFGRDAFDARFGLRYPRQHLLFRVLDDSLMKELQLRFTEQSLPADSINQLPVENVTVFVVENKVNLLTLPNFPRGLAIGGLGKAIALVADIGWLCDSRVFYWGDLDVEGFEMLAQFRDAFPHTESLMMTLDTFQRFENLSIEWTNRSRFTPQSLTSSEQVAYQFVLENCKRLEQERIPQDYVLEIIQAVSEPDC